MDRPLRIGILHYSCPPVVGGVEEILNQHATFLHRIGQHVSVLAGMGEVYTESFPVRIEPLLGSQNVSITKAHEQSRNGDHKELKRLTKRIYSILKNWSQDLDVVLAHNVLHMPFNLSLTLALRRLAASAISPVVVSWAHDSPYFESAPPEHLNDHPWNILRRTHPAVHYVTISGSRRRMFDGLYGDVPWKVIPNGIDPAGFFYLDPKSVGGGTGPLWPRPGGGSTFKDHPSQEPGTLPPYHPRYQDLRL